VTPEFGQADGMGGLANLAVEQAADSPSLAAAAHRGRSAAHREAKEAW
jgi:hypothetical protein